VVQQAVERYGRLDGAFNNAGIGGGDWTSTSADDYDTLMQINVRGMYMCVREEVAQFLRQGDGGGAIVNCGSTNSHRAAAGQSLQYTVSKHAVAGLTKQAAVEYGRFGIRVNTLSPGWIPTEMTQRISDPNSAVAKHFAMLSPMQRWGTTAEIASTACFLLSSSASYINGVDLLVDGGMCQSEPPGAFYSHNTGALLKAGAPHFGRPQSPKL
jgi:NAD(P)-dependent dehydrogenase (short-subunit alcohol dehydrogenase family)